MTERRTVGRTAVLYTVVRFVIFVVLAGVLFGLGVAVVLLSGHHLGWRETKPVLLTAAFLAIPLSMLVSWFALARQRTELTGVVERRVRAYQDRLAAKTAAEDAYADAVRASGQRDRPPGSPGSPASPEPEPEPERRAEG